MVKVQTIQLYPSFVVDFFNCFNFAKPLHVVRKTGNRQYHNVLCKSTDAMDEPIV